MYGCTFGKGLVGRAVCIFWYECIWRCQHKVLCGILYALYYINCHSFIKFALADQRLLILLFTLLTLAYNKCFLHLVIKRPTIGSYSAIVVITLTTSCFFFCFLLLYLQLSVKTCFIRGSVVRYVQLPADECDTQLLQDAARKEAAQNKQRWLTGFPLTVWMTNSIRVCVCVCVCVSVWLHMCDCEWVNDRDRECVCVLHEFHSVNDRLTMSTIARDYKYE